MSDYDELLRDKPIGDGNTVIKVCKACGSNEFLIATDHHCKKVRHLVCVGCGKPIAF